MLVTRLGVLSVLVLYKNCTNKVNLDLAELALYAAPVVHGRCAGVR